MVETIWGGGGVLSTSRTAPNNFKFCAFAVMADLALMGIM
jgi:hypothetical protein